MRDVPVDDAEAWRLATSGNGEAFNALFRLHRDRVFRHAARLVDSPADADDVAAAAFFDLWRRRRAVTLVAGSPLPWLLVTASNHARNARRSTARYRAVLDRVPRDPQLVDPEERALHRVAVDREETPVRIAMRHLSAVDLNLLLLTTLEDVPIREAAQLLGLRESTARSRLSRAKSRLRQVLNGDDLATNELTTEEA